MKTSWPKKTSIKIGSPTCLQFVEKVQTVTEWCLNYFPLFFKFVYSKLIHFMVAAV